MARRPDPRPHPWRRTRTPLTTRAKSEARRLWPSRRPPAAFRARAAARPPGRREHSPGHRGHRECREPEGCLAEQPVARAYAPITKNSQRAQLWQEDEREVRSAEGLAGRLSPLSEPVTRAGTTLSVRKTGRGGLFRRASPRRMRRRGRGRCRGRLPPRRGRSPRGPSRRRRGPSHRAGARL